MKRLTDEQVANRHQRMDRSGMLPAASLTFGEIQTDHLRARDDRKLLVSLVSRSVAIASGVWTPAERAQWEEIRREVTP